MVNYENLAVEFDKKQHDIVKNIGEEREKLQTLTSKTETQQKLVGELEEKVITLRGEIDNKIEKRKEEVVKYDKQIKEKEAKVIDLDKRVKSLESKILKNLKTIDGIENIGDIVKGSKEEKKKEKPKEEKPETKKEEKKEDEKKEEKKDVEGSNNVVIWKTNKKKKG